MRLAILGVAALFIAALANAGDGAIEPSTPWGVDYSDDQCKLYRNFGDGDETIFLEIRQFSPDGSPKFVIAGKKIKARPGTDIRNWLEPEANPTISFPYYSHFGEDMEGMIFSRSFIRSEEAHRLTKEFPRNGDWRDVDEFFQIPLDAQKLREAEITHLTIDRGLTNKLRLHIGRMSIPMNAMRTCLDDLVSHWGLDPSVQKSLSRKPLPKSNPGEWAKWSDFPRRPLLNGYSGIVEFRLMVDETGVVTSCTIQEATNPIEFGQKSCEVMLRNASFEPALDSGGQPVKSYWTNRIFWMN